jgi:hypothetical protein
MEPVIGYSRSGWTGRFLCRHEARVEIVTGTTPENTIVRKALLFNVRGSERNRWFNREHYTGGGWTDLMSDTTIDWEASANGRWFSIFGWGPTGRAFDINYSEGGCPRDIGWLQITTVDVPCPFDTPHVVRYSPSGGRANVQNNFAVADALIIFVR